MCALSETSPWLCLEAGARAQTAEPRPRPQTAGVWGAAVKVFTPKSAVLRDSADNTYKLIT